MASEVPARTERRELCDLLMRLGPAEPTLCEGWQTSDLAAHLLLRERRPLTALGIVARPLAGRTARVQREIASGSFPALVDRLRKPPVWARAAPVDGAVNTLEMFIHHEDVRRAQPDWQPRPEPPAPALLWRRVRSLARLRLRRFPAAVVVQAPGYPAERTGRGGADVVLGGDPGELALFLAGRSGAALVEISGPTPLTERLRSARFAM